MDEKKSRIDMLYKTIRKMNYEKFSEISDLILKEKKFSGNDIEGLFNIFMIDWLYSSMEPWQYHKIQDIIFVAVIEKPEERMKIFANNIIKMVLNYPEHIDSFFSMMKSSFSEKENVMFNDEIRAMGGEEIINQYLKNGNDMQKKMVQINNEINNKESIELEEIGEFEFVNSRCLQGEIEIDFFQDSYDACITIYSQTEWEISDSLTELIAKFIQYLKQNKERIECKILEYYEKEVKNMAEEGGWIEFYKEIYRDIDDPKDLGNIMELIGIDIDDYGEDGVEFQIVFSDDWEELTMVQINQKFEIETVGEYF